MFTISEINKTLEDFKIQNAATAKYENIILPRFRHYTNVPISLPHNFYDEEGFLENGEEKFTAMLNTHQKLMYETTHEWGKLEKDY